MKRLFAIVFFLAVMLSICGCSQTRVTKGSDVTLTFIYGEENIRVVLDDEEAEKVIAILDGNRYDSITSGVPSCGFDRNISLTVGNRVFAIACDTCNCVQDLGNLKYFDISQADMAYIHSLFEEYGGYFPCV